MLASKTIDQNTQDLLQSAVKNIPADFAEIRAEESSTTRIVFRGPEPELVAEPESYGFFIRVLINGSWGVATFTDLSKLKAKIAEAVSFAKIAGKGNVELAQSPITEAYLVHQLIKDFRQIPLNKKFSQIKKYNHLLLTGAKGIQTTNLIYQDQLLTKFYVNSRGSKIFEQRPYTRISFSAIARDEDVIETYRGSQGHVGGYEIIENLDSEMVDVAKQTVKLAKCPKVKSGKYTVILDPFMAGTFAHEAFGHFSEADHQYENPKILEQMEMGRKLGSDKVTIIDDPNLLGAWGNFVYDDEGTQAKLVPLLTNGVITGRLHSLETAGKLKEIPNGRARADGFSSKPIVRMSNTYFKPGADKLKDLIASTKKGILVVNWIAGMTALENFTFTAIYGELIENGKLTSQVRGVKLMGNMFETLKNIDGISDDFAIDAGTCGKQGQHMQVGSGGAYVRINNVSVGGE